MLLPWGSGRLGGHTARRIRSEGGHPALFLFYFKIEGPAAMLEFIGLGMMFGMILVVALVLWRFIALFE